MAYEENEQRMDVIRREEFNASETMPLAETAMTAVAQREKSMIESRFVVAMKIGRNWPQIRATINKLCEDPTFAAEAMYIKPMGATNSVQTIREEDGKQVAVAWADMTKRERLLAGSRDWPRGFSIRFIEAVMAEAGHFHAPATVVWDDDFKRVTSVMVLDMVKNNDFQRTVIITKRKERTYKKKGETVHSTRLNSNGETVYVVEATPEDVATMEASAVSKAIRTGGERLLPPHLKAEWRAIIQRTIENEMATDPYGALKKMLDSFIRFGVTPAMIEELLGHPLDAILPAEATILRGLLLAVGNGEGTWEDVVTAIGLERGADDKAKPTKTQATILDRIHSQQKKEAEARSAKGEPAKTEPKPEPVKTEQKPEAGKAPPAAEAPKPEAKPEPKSEPSEPSTDPGTARELTPEELRELDERDAREEAEDRQGGLLIEDDAPPVISRPKRGR